jgi:hypothetical protein
MLGQRARAPRRSVFRSRSGRCREFAGTHVRWWFVLALALVLAGCAAKKGGIPGDRGRPGPAEECQEVTGRRSESWYGLEGGSWWLEGGSYFLVSRSFSLADTDRAEGQETEGRERGRHESAEVDTQHESEERALRAVVSAGVDDALRLLSSRGVTLNEARAEAVRAGTTRDLLEGLEPGFPRVHIAGSVVERCPVAVAAKPTWRATVLLEYPAALARGDAVNARWRSRQLSDEAAIVLLSAESYFATGRWFDGLIELRRAKELIDEAARPLASGTVETELDDLLDWAVGAVSIEPVSSIDVVEIGERRETTVTFRAWYVWNGRRIPAVGVPVAFRTRGFDAVLSNDAESDQEGLVRSRIIAAYGEAGAHSIEPSIDVDVVGAAVGAELAGMLDSTSEVRHEVMLARAAHAVSVCLELTGLDERDATQFRAGFTRRLELDGYRYDECGADTGVLIRSSARLTSKPTGGAWLAVVGVDASAFDQRMAVDVGSAAFDTAEESEEGQREAEVLALKEAGRLLASYFSRRMLVSGQ